MSDINESVKIEIASTDAIAYAPITVSPTSVMFSSSGGSKTISVSCQDTSWSAGGGSTWCTIEKTSSTTAKITVTSHRASKNSYVAGRGMGVVCFNGSQTAWINVDQEDDAYYDRSDKTTFYKQPAGACAFTCGAMCVHISPETLQNKYGLDPYLANWAGIAKAGNMTATVDTNGNLRKVYDILKEGYPVIAHINSSQDHWVVICTFRGVPSDLNHGDFSCLDPNKTSTIIPLTSATRYNKSELDKAFTIVVFR